MRRDAIEQLLAAECGVEVRVVGEEQLAHARGEVTRARIEPTIPGVGETVIVKRRDPDTYLGAFAVINLRTEERVLRLLHRTTADVAPRIVAGGEAANMLILTDVGRPLEPYLFGDGGGEDPGNADPDRATEALVALAEATARLHKVPCDDDPQAFDDLDTWTIANRDDGWHDLAKTAGELGFPTPTTKADQEHDDLLHELRNPEPTATVLVHGDLGPNNAVIEPDNDRDNDRDNDDHRAPTCRLVDFEGAGPQHIGLDAAMLRFPFAWYGRWAPLPPHAQQAMEDAYRAHLGWPDHELDHAIATGCMAMALLRIERLPRIAADDQTPELAFRRRTQIVATLDTAIEAARHVDRYPALCGWLDTMAAAIRARWAEARETAPPYAAYLRP